MVKMQQCEVANINSACVMVHDKKDCRNLFPEICQHCDVSNSDHELRTSNGVCLHQRNLKCLGWMWVTSTYASAISNIGICHFLIMHSSSVTQTKGFSYYYLSYLSSVLISRQPSWFWSLNGISYQVPEDRLDIPNGLDTRGRTVGTLWGV